MRHAYFAWRRSRAASGSRGRSGSTVCLCTWLRLSLQVCLQPLCKLCLLSSGVQVPRLKLDFQFLQISSMFSESYRIAALQRNGTVICPTSTVSFFTSSTFITTLQSLCSMNTRMYNYRNLQVSGCNLHRLQLTVQTSGLQAASGLQRGVRTEFSIHSHVHYICGVAFCRCAPSMVHICCESKIKCSFFLGVELPHHPRLHQHRGLAIFCHSCAQSPLQQQRTIAVPLCGYRSAYSLTPQSTRMLHIDASHTTSSGI